MSTRRLQSPVDVVTAYWRDVDRNGGSAAHMFYEENGDFHFGDRRFSGRGEIRLFYTWRRSGGERTTRHVISNCLADHEGDVVRIDYLLAVYGGTGAPVLESKPANMIADMTALLAHTADGTWLMRTHMLMPVMRGPGMLAIPDPLPGLTGEPSRHRP